MMVVAELGRSCARKHRIVVPSSSYDVIWSLEFTVQSSEFRVRSSEFRDRDMERVRE